MTDQSSNNENKLPPEIDETRSQCWSCKYGLCGLKEGVEVVTTVGDIFVGGPDHGPSGPGGMGMDVDPTLRDHHLLFSGDDEKKDEDPKEEDEMTQFTIRNFVHAICCHPMLKDKVADMPIVLNCNQYDPEPEK